MKKETASFICNAISKSIFIGACAPMSLYYIAGLPLTLPYSILGNVALIVNKEFVKAYGPDLINYGAFSGGFEKYYIQNKNAILGGISEVAHTYMGANGTIPIEIGSAVINDALQAADFLGINFGQDLGRGFCAGLVRYFFTEIVYENAGTPLTQQCISLIKNLDF